MKRREFLKYTSLGLLGSVTAGTALTWSPRAHSAILSSTFNIIDGTINQADGTAVYARGYSSTTTTLEVPGKSLTAQEGDTIRITINNTLNTTHSFVIDGVVDSGDIAPGTSKIIEFTVNQAGSYLYYDKTSAPYNRVLGLHGGLAVMPAGSSNELYAGSPTFKKQLFWIFNDIDSVWHSSLQNGGTPSTQFKPRYFTLNGLSLRPPGAPGYSDPAVDSGYDTRSKLKGSIGDRTLIRVLNAGECTHSMHWHANHVEWLTQNGSQRSEIWLKDVVAIENKMGKVDVIYPFELPPDAHPPVSTGKYVMHCHDEMTQTAGGGLYQFGSATLINFV